MKIMRSMGIAALSCAFLFGATACSDDDEDKKMDHGVVADQGVNLQDQSTTQQDQTTTTQDQGSTTATSLGSCTNTVESIRTCTSYIGSSFAPGIVAMKTGCEGAGGAWSADDCDRSDAQGYCVVAAGMETETHVYSYDLAQVSLDATKTACESSGGDWVALEG